MNTENLDLDLDLGEEPAKPAEAPKAKPEVKQNILKNPTVEPEQPKDPDKPRKRKKLRTILLSTLIPVAVIGGGVGTFFAVKSCKTTKNVGNLLWEDGVEHDKLTTKSWNLVKDKESTIEFTVSADAQHLSEITLKIGDSTITLTYEEGAIDDNNKVTIPADKMLDDTVTISSFKLEAIPNFEAIAYESGHEGETMIAASKAGKKFAGKLTIPAELTVGGATKKVTGIAEGGFKDCGSITEYDFEKGDEIQTIGASAFQENTALTTFKFPSNVTIIEDNTFTNCKSLKTIELNDNITTIKHNAFDSTAIEAMTLPKSITKIEPTVFSGCEKLTSVTFADTTKTWADSIDKKAVVITDVEKNASNFKDCAETNKNWGWTGIEVIVTKKAFFEKVAEWVDNGFVKSTNEYLKDVIQISNISGEGFSIKKLKYDVISQRTATAILNNADEVVIGNPNWTAKESEFKQEGTDGVTYTITDDYVSYVDENTSTAKDQIKEVRINKYGYVEKEVHAEEKTSTNEFVDAGYSITYPDEGPDVTTKKVSFDSQTEFELADYCDVNSGQIHEVNENDKSLSMKIKKKDGTTHEGDAVNVSLQTADSEEIAKIETTVPSDEGYQDLDFTLTDEDFKKIDSSKTYKLVITAKI